MKDSFVFGMYPNGMVTPVIIRTKEPPFVFIGDKLITDKGTMVCLSEEKGRYSEQDEVERICNVMDMGKESLPMALGTITEKYWHEDEK